AGQNDWTRYGIGLPNAIVMDLRYVAPDPPEAFDEAGSDWFARTGGTAADWDADRGRLRDWHARLRAAAAALDPARLDAVTYDRYTCEDLLIGAAAHDAYHAGQVRLLRRMQTEDR
ncbi:MAG: hypothetical protein R3362_03110, partial [Rhodothermales bacterium]|nr:hypothetical protein [Rhodothermales bacterium]